MFQKIFNSATKQISDINVQGTGYYENLIDLPVKETSSFIDNKGRKGVIIPLEKSNMIVFERYSNSEKEIIVENGSPKDLRILFNSPLSYFSLKVANALNGKSVISIDDIDEYKKDFTEGEYLDKLINKAVDYLEERNLIAS